MDETNHYQTFKKNPKMSQNYIHKIKGKENKHLFILFCILQPPASICTLSQTIQWRICVIKACLFNKTRSQFILLLLRELNYFFVMLYLGAKLTRF